MTPGTLKAVQVALVEPVAYLRDRVKRSMAIKLAAVTHKYTTQ
jgi:hypothetical protein